MPLLPQSIADLVAQDGVARQATANDNTVHMLFRDGTLVRSCLIQDWPAEQLVLATHEQERQDATALRAQVITIAQTAVGTRVDLLTAVQVRALIAVLLWKGGALDKSGVVQPLASWVDR
jgi:hypothetical protein